MTIDIEANGSNLERIELLTQWLIWNQAVKYIQHDIFQVESLPMRFPTLGIDILRHLGSKAFQMKHEAAKELQANGIRVVKEKVEGNEILIAWSQRGQLDILRIHESTLRLDVQKKINEVMQKFIDERKGLQQPQLEP